MQQALEIRIINEEKMQKLGLIFGQLAFPQMVIAMNGNLGAGKTTMTKGIGQALGIKRTINSPTFTIMKIYEGRLNLYHLDVYRLTDSHSDFDLEEYFYYGGVSVVEWADNVKDLLPSDTIYLDFSINEDTSRTIKVVTENSDFLEKLKKACEKL